MAATVPRLGISWGVFPGSLNLIHWPVFKNNVGESQRQEASHSGGKCRKVNSSYIFGQFVRA
jgi:hypothetical protein